MDTVIFHVWQWLNMLSVFCCRKPRNSIKETIRWKGLCVRRGIKDVSINRHLLSVRTGSTGSSKQYRTIAWEDQQKSFSINHFHTLYVVVSTIQRQIIQQASSFTRVWWHTVSSGDAFHFNINQSCVCNCKTRLCWAWRVESRENTKKETKGRY